jgi:hypothetical protein
MWCKMKPSLLLASLAVFVTTSVYAQNVSVTGPLAAPLVMWETPIMATLSPGVGLGNGAYLTPDELHVITTSAGGTLTAFDAVSGAPIWEYDPPPVGTSLVTCHSGVTFANSSYIIYTIIDDENAIEPFS